MQRRWIIAIMLALACVAAPRQVSAQQDSGTGLRARLQTLREELAAERQALEDLRRQQSAELDQLREQRDELAGRAVDAELRRQQLADEQTELTASVAELAERADAWRQAGRDVLRGARSAAEKLAIHLREVPGEAARQQQLEQIASTMEQADRPAPAAAEQLAALLAIADQAHAQAATLGVRSTELWTAREQREPVELLHAGHVGFAYLAPGGRIGLALASPADASGYRWSEDLPAPQAALIRDAITRLQTRRADEVTLPLDVTGQLRLDAVTADEGLFATLEAGGLVLVPLGAVALLALVLMAERVWVLYGRSAGDSAAATRLIEAARAGREEAARKHAAQARGAIGRTLQACLARRRQGQHAMEDAIQAQLLHELPRLQRFLGGIAILAAVAPLLGLLGTVTGIIQTFGVIQAFGNANVSLMADGISEALITTAAGLVIAIPILLVHSALSGRVDRIISDAEKHAATLLNLLAHSEEP
ncbi:MAG: MotA/TolQ/ExbB proton channel family protein [Phycisphaeraceae bacterium]